jgi:hypothetical protein
MIANIVISLLTLSGTFFVQTFCTLPYLLFIIVASSFVFQGKRANMMMASEKSQVKHIYISVENS